MRHAAVLLALLVVGCGETHNLVVDLRTDYAPGVEVDAVRTVVLDGDREVMATVTREDDLLAGWRCAELTGLDAGSVRVRVELLAGGASVATRDLLVELDVDRVVTAVVTRACEGIDCPEACLNGLCVELGCTPETPERCPMSGLCEDASGCDPPAVACVMSSCVDGACLDAPVADACTATQWCDPNEGCVPLPMMGVDAGPPDAGALDAGPAGVDAGGGCAPGTADCNGDGSDGCEVDLTDSRVHCGMCGNTCAASERCVARSCVTAVAFDGFRHVGRAGANVRAFALDVHDDGRVALAGKFSGATDFGAGPEDAGGTDAGFVAIYTGAGVFERALIFRATSTAGVNGVELSGAGAWVMGETRGTLTFPAGGPMGPAASGIDPFWAHYDPAGVYRGSGVDGRAGGELGHDVAAVPGGGAIVVGYVNGAEVGGRAFVGGLPGGRSDILVARVDDAGRVQWVKFYGGPENDEARGVGVIGSTIYVTGFFREQVSFGGAMRMSRGGSDVFVLALDLSGGYLGDVTGGGAGDDFGLGLDVHASGDAIVVGEMGGGGLGGAALTSPGVGGDAFVARVASDGSVAWLESAGDDQNDVAHGVTVRGDGVFVAGYFRGLLPIGGTNLDAGGGRAAYVARVSAGGGQFEWGMAANGGSAVGLGIGVDAVARVTVGGFFTGDVDFGDGPVTSVGGNDGFIWRVRER